MDWSRPDTDSMLAAFMDSDFSRDEAAWNEEVGSRQTVDDAYVPEPDEHGDYPHPLLDVLRQGGPEAVERCLEMVDNQLGILAMSAREGLDDPTHPIVVGIKTGFTQIRSALLSMGGDFEAGLGGVQDGVNRLMDAFGFFQRMRAAVMHIPCPACSSVNHKSSARCQECSAALPRQPENPQQRLLAVAAEGVSPDANVAGSTPNYQRVTDALAAWGVQELDDDELLSELEVVEAQLQGHREANDEEGADLEDLSEDLLVMIDEALEVNLEALAEMKRYWSDGNPEHIRAGYEALGRATQELVEVFETVGKACSV